MRRHAIATTFATVFAMSCAFGASLSAQDESGKPNDDLPTGIVKNKPDTGRSVATPMGYMIPYKAKIPGSDVTFEMIPVPGGTFQVDADGGESQIKSHVVRKVKIELKPYWIGKTEVTWAEFRDYMDLQFVFREFHSFKVRKVTEDNEADVITAPSTIYDPVFVHSKEATLQDPAVSMTLYTAKQYTKWLSKTSGTFYRLPSALEWEYACRAGSEKSYSFGDDPKLLDEYGWHKGNSDGNRHPVAQKKPNAWGIYDMHGNAAEWVLDGMSVDGLKWPDRKVKSNTSVRWPIDRFAFMALGGSCVSTADQCQNSSHVFPDEDFFENDANWPQSPFWFASYEGNTIGFRIVRPLQEPATEKEKQLFWVSGIEEIDKDIEIRINAEGKGAWGIADRSLPKATNDIFKEKGGKRWSQLDTIK